MKGFVLEIEPSLANLKEAYRREFRKSAPLKLVLYFGIFTFLFIGLELFSGSQETLTAALQSALKFGFSLTAAMTLMDWLAVRSRTKREHRTWTDGKYRAVSLRETDISLSAARFGSTVHWENLRHYSTQDAMHLYIDDGFWGATHVETIPLKQLNHEERMFLLEQLVHHDVRAF